KQVGVLVIDHRHGMLGLRADINRYQVFILALLKVTGHVLGFAVVEWLIWFERTVVLENNNSGGDSTLQRQIEQRRENKMKLLDLERQLACSAFVGVADDIEVFGSEIEPFVFALGRDHRQQNYSAYYERTRVQTDPVHSQLLSFYYGTLPINVGDQRLKCRGYSLENSVISQREVDLGFSRS